MKNERKCYFRYEVWTRKNTEENKHNKYVLREVEGEKEEHVKNQKDIKERKYKYLKQAKKICTDNKSHQRKKTLQENTKNYNSRKKFLKKKDLKVYHERGYHVTDTINPRWPTWHVKLLDFKGKEKSLWTSRQKEQVP